MQTQISTTKIKLSKHQAREMVENIYCHLKLIPYLPILDNYIPNNLFYSTYVLCIMDQILRFKISNWYCWSVTLQTRLGHLYI